MPKSINSTIFHLRKQIKELQEWPDKSKKVKTENLLIIYWIQGRIYGLKEAKSLIK